MSAEQTIIYGTLTFEVYISDMDGKAVLQIDTEDGFPQAHNGLPILRINLNDGRCWEGLADGSEEYGEQT